MDGPPDAAPGTLDDEDDRSWLPVAAGFFLYVATAVAWLWIVSVARLGRPDIAAAVAVGWVGAMATAIAVLLRKRQRTAALRGRGG